GEQVAHPVVVADGRMLVVRRWIPRLCRQETSALHPLGPIGEQHPPTAGGDDLVAVEGKRRQRPLSAGRLPPVRGTQRFSRVLDDGHLEATTHLPQAAVVAALSEQIDRDQGLRKLAPAL